MPGRQEAGQEVARPVKRYWAIKVVNPQYVPPTLLYRTNGTYGKPEYDLLTENSDDPLPIFPSPEDAEAFAIMWKLQTGSQEELEAVERTWRVRDNVEGECR